MRLKYVNERAFVSLILGGGGNEDLPAFCIYSSFSVAILSLPRYPMMRNFCPCMLKEIKYLQHTYVQNVSFRVSYN